ncbi:MAG TPA: BatA domain-containing protein [bacterium]|nr:BatA domain-containing protein [bacterium]HQO33218.1 BatA domain-containing protein [bacterium]
MSFVAVGFLLGIAAVAGPILAHLLARPRYRRVPFTMLRFLHAGKAEMETRRRLRDFLLLMLRCTMIILAALLFAGPLWRGGEHEGSGRPVHYLALDNSLSMNYRESGETLFRRMILQAREYIRTAPPNALFHIYPLASGDPLNGKDRQEALVYVSQLRSVPLCAQLQSFLSDLRESRNDRNTDRDISACILSDFSPQVLRGLQQVSSPIPVTEFHYEAIRPGQGIVNWSVPEASIQAAEDGRLRVESTVVNCGDTPDKRTFGIRVFDKTLASCEVELKPQERTRVSMEIPVDSPNTTYLPIECALVETDGLAEDNIYYAGIAIPQRSRMRVLVVGKNQRETFLLKTALETLARHNPSDGITVEPVARAQLEDPAVLSTAHAVLFTSFPEWLNLVQNVAKRLGAFVDQGGKIGYFVSANYSKDTLDLLWRSGLLPAMPKTLKQEATHIAPQPEIPLSGHPRFLDASVLPSIQNYKIDRLPLTGYYECETSSNGVCVWRLQNDAGFLYSMERGSGSLLLINTSADDSLGALFKSPAATAFSRYLLGRNVAVSSFGFPCGEPIILPLSSSERAAKKQQTDTWLITPSGKRLGASCDDFGIRASSPLEIGWTRTVVEPTRYAGVNAPRDESDLSAADASALENTLEQIFQRTSKPTVAEAVITAGQEYHPLWNEIGWLLLVLIFFECFIANRLKR